MPGALGDVTILSDDVSTATADDIRAMTVVAAIVGGTVVDCSNPSICRGAVTGLPGGPCYSRGPVRE